MRPYFGDEEKKALSKYDYSEGFLTEFKYTQDLEAALCERLSVNYCVMVNNGTIALTIAALACEIKAGDEVIMPNFTMIATPNSIKLLGAIPVFCDVEKESLCLDINEMKSKITNKTKAVILVNSNGRYPNYNVDELRIYLNEQNIFLIEDSAQALGSLYSDNVPIGNKSNIATLSFSAPKIISTGQGGAVFTNDKLVYEKVKRLKDFGRLSGGDDIHDYFGINCKFTDLQAIIGLTQLKKLNKRIEIRKQQHGFYTKSLANICSVEVINNDLKYTCPWFSEVLVEKRDELMTFLKNNGVGTRAMYPPINLQKIYNFDGLYPVSHDIGNRGLWLPSHMGVKEKDIIFISSLINDFYESNK